MHTSRRGFLGGMSGLGALAWSGGCRSLLGKAAAPRSCRDYYCTWETQRALWKGKTCERDNLNEQIVYGAGGWADTLFPQARNGLLMVLDDGWDVPYGAVNKDEGYAAFGSLIPDAVRFPSLRGSTAERLREMRVRLEDRGWAGLGLWIAAQAFGETYAKPFDMAYHEEDLKRKLSESAEAGVKYWKVDWGVHQPDVAYRELMSRLALRYAPDTIVDHSCGFDNAINGAAYPYDAPWAPGKPLPKLDGDTGRMIGVAGFEKVRQQYTAMMAYSDSFRTYDTLGPMTSATALERAVFELECADATKSKCTINVEDEPLIGAGLALGIGVMRAAIWPDPKVPEPDPKQRRIAEITRCVRWRRYAPVFGSDRGCPVVYSDRVGEEIWKFEKDSTWWSEAFGRTLRQCAPSVVARGLPLPEVKSPSGENPLVCASVHPDTGAIAVASLPLLTVRKGRHTPLADVRLSAKLAEGVPLGVFGEFGSITLEDALPAAPVFVRDLADGVEIDITAEIRREGNRLTLPGDLLATVGKSMNPVGDPSSPGVVVYH